MKVDNAALTQLKFSKTRYAPTPSGFLHLGNVLSFAVTAALAQHTNARIFLRIDDLDRPRINECYIQDIFDTLNFLGLPWHDGPEDYRQYEQEYAQLHRMNLCMAALQQLQSSGGIFACTCSRSHAQIRNNENTYHGNCIAENMPFDVPYANWRVNTNNAGTLTVQTLQGPVTTHLTPDIHHFVVKKKDGFPAYQLTSLIDDVHFGIDLVVRGQDLWPSTLAQLHLAHLLQQDTFPLTTFHHHRLLANGSGEKLSKSAGATSIQYLRSQHKTPADIFTAAAAMTGYNDRVETWQELAALIL